MCNTILLVCIMAGLVLIGIGIIVLLLHVKRISILIMNNIQTNNNARTVNIGSTSPTNDIEYQNNVVNQLEIDIKTATDIIGDNTGTFDSTVSTPMPNSTPMPDDADEKHYD